MIRLLREVDYNKSDKTFYFNDAANVARNVFTIHEECLEHILYIILQFVHFIYHFRIFFWDYIIYFYKYYNLL